MPNKKNTKEEHITELLTGFGKRNQPDSEMMNQSRINVMNHWQEKVSQRKRQRIYTFSIAASVLFVFTLGLLSWSFITTEKSSYYIKSAFIQGTVLAATNDTDWKNITAGDLQNIPQGSQIKTSDSGFASLTLSDNTELRLNHNSHIELIDDNNIKLLNGEVYVDADNSVTSGLSIQTRLGNIKHIGTRYSVKFSNNLEVAVRNGLVEIQAQNDRIRIEHEKGVTFSTAGDISRFDIPQYDSSWRWTHHAIKPFKGENKSLYDYIIWFAHENGYKVEWNNNMSETQQVRLSGQLPDVISQKQIEAVFLSTRFNYKIHQGLLSIM